MQHKCVYKNVSWKRFANVFVCGEKEVYVAEPMEDFEQHEDYLYIIEIFLLSSCSSLNTSAYNDETW